jgi:hypothetical protein
LTIREVATAEILPIVGSAIRAGAIRAGHVLGRKLDRIFVVVAVGAFIPLVFGRETVGQLETVTEAVPALA